MSERCYVKCDKCRKDRKSCSPRNRNWARKERCRRCQNIGHECGPPIQLRPGRRTQVLQVQNGSLQPPVQLDVVANERAEESSNSDAGPVPLHNNVDQSGSLIGAEGLSCLQLVGIVLLQRMLLALISDYDKYGRASLVVRKLEEIRVQIVGLHLELHEKAQKIFRSGSRNNLDMSKTISVTELLLRQLEEQCYNASRRRIMPVQQESIEEFNSDVWHATQRHLPKLKSVLSCVAYMPVPTSPAPENTARQDSYLCVTDRVAGYKRAAELAKEALMSLRADTESMDHLTQPNYIQKRFSFPACHIALLNGDKDAALSLWRQSPEGQTTDLLGRSLAHLAVISGNMNFLRELSQANGGLLQVHDDFLSLSLEATATILNDNLTFVVLQELVGPGSDPRVLGIAVDVGSSTIVKAVIDNRLGRPPFTGLVQQAIGQGQRDIVEIFLGPLEMHPHTQEDINLLVNTADQYGHMDIRERLLNLRPVLPTYRDALADLNLTQSYIHGYRLPVGAPLLYSY